MNAITEPIPIIENEFGKRSTEVVEWLNIHSAIFLNEFGQISFQKLNGIGWEEISRSPGNSLCKINFGEGKTSPIDRSSYQQQIRDGKLQFTGKGLCAFSSFVIGSAVIEKFPDAQVNFAQIWTDMSETKEVDDFWPEQHQIIEISFEGEKPFFVDFTYGQVNHNVRTLIRPIKELRKYYFDIGPIELTKVDFKENSEDFITQVRKRHFLNAVTEADLMMLKDCFSKEIIPLKP